MFRQIFFGLVIYCLVSSYLTILMALFFSYALIFTPKGSYDPLQIALYPFSISAQRCLLRMQTILKVRCGLASSDTKLPRDK